MWAKLQGLKTYLVTLVTGLVAVAVQAMGQAGFDWREIVPWQYQGYAGIAVTLLIMCGSLYMRKVTKGPAKPLLPRRRRGVTK